MQRKGCWSRKKKRSSDEIQLDWKLELDLGRIQIERDGSCEVLEGLESSRTCSRFSAGVLRRERRDDCEGRPRVAVAPVESVDVDIDGDCFVVGVVGR